MNNQTHDLIVIGGGPGGYVAAIRAAQLDLNAACVELDDRLGGTCLRVGCIPSKVLLESSERYHQAAHEAAEHGFAMDGVRLDLPALLARKERIVEELTGGIAALFKKNKITRYTGRGTITAVGQVSVDGEEPVELTAKHIVIATGSTPATLKGVEPVDGLLGDSTLGLSFDSVPGHLVVVGAGYIGLELGSVWRRLGSRVTILEYLDRILPGIDSEIAREALRLYKQQGLEFQLGARVTGAQVTGKGKSRRCSVEAEGQPPVECDRVLLVTGRWPNTAGLGLEQVGVAVDQHGFIKVDQRFRTNVPGIYAIGDVTGAPLLAHKASAEGLACTETIAGGYGHVSSHAIPSVVYTAPEIAAVGRTEDELKASGVDYKKGVFMFRASGRAKALGQTDGRVKVLADTATDRLLGVHIIGPRAGDLIAECVLAMEFGATAEDIARTCHAHPTLGESVMEAALAVDKRAIHS